MQLNNGCREQVTFVVCAPSVRPLLVALNDEDVRVRGLAVDLAGRLGHVNPAVVLPTLRRHLMQLLADLEHSPDSRQREGGPWNTLPGILDICLLGSGTATSVCSCWPTWSTRPAPASAKGGAC